LVSHLRSGKNLLSLHTDLDVLEAENSVICRILDAFGLDKPVITEDNTKEDSNLAVIQVPDAGSITLHGGTWLFSNLRIPTPTAAPKEEEPETIQTLLKVIEYAK